MGNNKEFKIPLRMQKYYLDKYFKGGSTEVRKGQLKWSGKIKPSGASRTYDIDMSYSYNEGPRVWVYGDSLKKLDAQNFPHNYHIDKENKRVEICLYHGDEFTHRRLLSSTILPWTIEWLFHYEIWLATGQWCGGGVHPVIK